MIPGAVGYQCPRCVKADTRATRQNLGPYGGVRPRNPRLTTLILIAINAVVWAGIQVAGFTDYQSQIIVFLGLQPTGNWWTIITAMFTHIELWHVAVNCLALWFLGPILETLLGRGRFLTTYLVAGAVGSLFVVWLTPVYSLTVGASGCLFGLMGALLVLLWHQKADLRQLLIWLGINVVITVVWIGSISWQGHLGGLIGGLTIGSLWAFLPPAKYRHLQWLLLGGLSLLILGGLVARALI
jgi:membrane associated rhomboid family serine protease